MEWKFLQVHNKRILSSGTFRLKAQPQYRVISPPQCCNEKLWKLIEVVYLISVQWCIKVIKVVCRPNLNSTFCCRLAPVTYSESISLPLWKSIHLLVYSSTYSVTHPFIHSLSKSHSFSTSLIHSLSLIHPVLHSFIHSLSKSHSFSTSLISYLPNSLHHSLIHIFIWPLLFIHSQIPFCVYSGFISVCCNLGILTVWYFLQQQYHML